MMKSVLGVLAMTMVFALVMQHAAAQGKERRVMAWLCLELCDKDYNVIQQIDQMCDNTDTLSAVAYEMFTVSSAGHLEYIDGLTDPTLELQGCGLETWPVIASSSETNVRAVFANPNGVIQALISAASKNGFTGYNFGFEVQTSNTTLGTQYAAFLERVGTALHDQGLGISANVASYSSFWNFTEIAQTGIDRAIDMDIGSGSDWDNYLQKGLTSFPQCMLGAELDVYDQSNGGQNFTIEQMQYRFQRLIHANVQEIDIWYAPIPVQWWPMIKEFVVTPLSNAVATLPSFY